MLEKGKGGYSAMTIIAKDVVCYLSLFAGFAALVFSLSSTFHFVLPKLGTNCYCSLYVLSLNEHLQSLTYMVS